MISYKIETSKITTIIDDKKQAMTAFFMVMHKITYHKYIKLYELNGKIRTLKISIDESDTQPHK